MKISLIVVMVVSFLVSGIFQAHQIVNDLVGALVALGCEVEINHGSIEAVVAQVLLDTTDIDTGFKQGGAAKGG